MKSLFSLIASVASLLAATAGTAMADTGVIPEPGSIALVGIAIGAAVWAMRRRK